MEIRYFGHAAVLLTSAGGERLLIDPYESGGFGGKMQYTPIDIAADAVVCTHAHRDHSATDALSGSPVRVETGSFGPFEISRHTLAHDEYGGRRRGGHVDILDIACDGFRIVHLADVGQSPPGDLVARLRGPDCLLLPVGGYFTIGATQGWEWQRRLAPRVTIPIHYRTGACALPIRPVEGFLAHFDEFTRTGKSRIQLEAIRSPSGRVFVLEAENDASKNRFPGTA